MHNREYSPLNIGKIHKKFSILYIYITIDDFDIV